MSRPAEGSEFEPVLTGRYHFEFRNQKLAVVDMQLMPGTPPLTTIMEVCECKRPDCNGYNMLPIGPVDALALMGKVVSDLLDERDGRNAQQTPGVN